MGAKLQLGMAVGPVSSGSVNAVVDHLVQMIGSVARLRPDRGARCCPPLKLFQRVGNISLEAMKIARGLRKLDTD